MNFWKNLIKPFTVLAPMDDVTDFVFRELIASFGQKSKPDVFITEFASTDALTSKGYDSQILRLKYSEVQRPIVAQIWGRDPQKFFKIAKLIKELNFDGVDINMGCPDKTIIKTGSCSALIQNPNLAAEIIQATKEGSQGLPVSVKTRLGFKKIETDSWIPFLLNQNLDALTIHGRIASEMSQKPANWIEIGKCVKLKDQICPSTIIIGNGDIKSYSQVLEANRNYDVDGIMIGRGIFENILVFNKSQDIEKLNKKELINLYIKHIKLFEKTWGDKKNPSIIKKFMKVYLKGFEDATTLREQIANSKGYSEMLEILNSNKN